MTTIYLSSTYEDLKDYRSAVFEALRKAGVLAPKFWLRRLFSKDFWPPT